MTGLERVGEAVGFGAPDRVPVLPMAHFMTAPLAGIPIPEFATDGDRMAESLMLAQERFGWDGVSVGCDVAVESSAYGAETAFPDDGPPALKSHVLGDDPDALSGMRPADPLRDGRLPVLVSATARCVREIGDTCYVMTHMNDPLNQAGMFRGVETLMMDIYDRPGFVDELLAFSYRAQMALGTALVDAGAHCIFLGAALSSPNILSPAFYREKVQPLQRKMVGELHAYGARHVLVHVCGDVMPILDDIADTDCDIIDIDWQVDMAAAKDIVGGRAAIRGNINPARLLAASSDDIYEETTGIIRSAGDGGGLIIAAGCDIMSGTPTDNLGAMVRSSRENVR